MEGIYRKPFQGVSNIVRFNWHFYAIALLLIIAWLIIRPHLSQQSAWAGTIILMLAMLNLIVSLTISWFIYDRSDLYGLNWLSRLNIPSRAKLVNINAGFDETSFLLQQKYPEAELSVYDFYDAEKHTEVSIKRARKAYPPYPCTKAISTSQINLAPSSTDYIFTLLAAHEIRQMDERVIFFRQLKDALTDHGRIVVAEHLRDLPNFLAYTFGFFHFLPRKEWLQTFTEAGLQIDKEFNITPFNRAFILQKHGTTS